MNVMTCALSPPRAHTLSAGAMLVLLYGSVCIAQESPLNTSRAAFLVSEPGWKKGAAAARMLTDADHIGELERLLFDDDASVSLCAAWRRLEIQAQAQFLRASRGASSSKIIEAPLVGFHAFVEGRLRVPPSDGWTQALLSARMNRWGPISFDALHPYHSRSPFAEGIPEREATPTATLALNVEKPYAIFVGDPGHFEGHDAYTKFPREFIRIVEVESDSRGIDKHELPVEGVAAADRAVLVDPSGTPFDWELFCFERVSTQSDQDPRILWKSRMDSYWLTVSKMPHYIEFRLRDDVLYLFHYSASSIGVEALRMEDGRRVFSFNSGLPDPQLR